MDNYITKKEVGEMINNAVEEFAGIVSKGFEEQAKMFHSELKEEIGGLRSEFRSELKKEISGVRSELRSFRNEVLENDEKTMTELKAIRQEQTVNIGAHDRLQENIENHEIRIKKLEMQSV